MCEDDVETIRTSLLALAADLERRLAAARRALAELEEMTPPRDASSVPPVKPRDYQAMRPIDALEGYLKARRGVRIQFSKAEHDLVEGGVDPGQARWKNKDPEALVAQTLKIGPAQQGQSLRVDSAGRLQKGEDRKEGSQQRSGDGWLTRLIFPREECARSYASSERFFDSSGLAISAPSVPCIRP